MNRRCFSEIRPQNFFGWRYGGRFEKSIEKLRHIEKLQESEIKKLFDRLEPTDITSGKLLDASIKNSKAMEDITDKEGDFYEFY